MMIEDLPTPCLVLDLGILNRNLERMRAAIARHPGVTLRPHMKTAKSIEVARLAAPGFGPITVSTLAEAQYFADAGWRDQIYAVGITPQKLDRAAALGCRVITDDIEAAAAIALHPGNTRAMVEIDVGEGRGGVLPDEAVAIARGLGTKLCGIFTHAGHSYAGRSDAEMARIAEEERAGASNAAQALRDAGLTVEIVSLGSSPTALHARSLAGITEVRAGVYMFGDLYQAQLGTHGPDGIALTVLASVIGRKPQRHAVLLDAGGLAMSKDRSTANAPLDYGFGLMLDLDGAATFGHALMTRTHQEHGEVSPVPETLRVGDKVRVAPNHTCMTAAAHQSYHVVNGGRDVVAVWDRVNGW